MSDTEVRNRIAGAATREGFVAAEEKKAAENWRYTRTWICRIFGLASIVAIGLVIMTLFVALASATNDPQRVVFITVAAVSGVVGLLAGVVCYANRADD